MIAGLVELLITILAVPVIWLVWERYGSPHDHRYHWPFGPFSDVAMMLVLGLAVIWSLLGVVYPDDYGWRNIRRAAPESGQAASAGGLAFGGIRKRGHGEVVERHDDGREAGMVVARASVHPASDRGNWRPSR